MTTSRRVADRKVMKFEKNIKKRVLILLALWCLDFSYLSSLDLLCSRLSVRQQVEAWL
ncbi:hypothetical protein Pfo_020279, partial [Paulownia fortunei]